MSDFFDDEASEEPTTQPTQDEERLNCFVPVGIVEKKGMFFYGIYLDPSKTDEFEALLRKGFIRQREEDCDQIDIKPPKKPRTEQPSSSSGSTSSQPSKTITKNSQIRRIKTLLKECKVVPTEFHIQVGKLAVNKGLSFRLFQEQMKQFKSNTKDIQDLIQRLDELEKGFLFWIYKTQGLTDIQSELKDGHKIREDMKTGLSDFVKYLKGGVNVKMVKAGLTTWLLNDIAKPGSVELAIYCTCNQREMEQGWSYMYKMMKNTTGIHWTETYDKIVKEFQLFPSIKTAAAEVFEREQEDEL